jgi:hypothetical protein
MEVDLAARYERPTIKFAEKVKIGIQWTPPNRIRNQQVVGSSPTAGSVLGILAALERLR